MKNNLLFFVFPLLSTISFGQFLQEWNYQNLLNPATAGLNYDHELNVANSTSGIEFVSFYATSLVTYSTLLTNRNIGIGFNYHNERQPLSLYPKSGDSEFTLTGNKQFKLAEGMILSAGLGAGIALNTQLTYFEYGLPGSARKSMEPIFTSDIGVALKWKRWNTNIAINHFLNNQNQNFSNPEYLTSNFFTEYVFGKVDGFQIAPQVGYTQGINKFHTTFGNLMISYKSKYTLSLGLRSRATYFASASAIFFNKIRLGYTYGQNPYITSDGTNINFHEFNLALVLNRRRTY